MFINKNKFISDRFKARRTDIYNLTTKKLFAVIFLKYSFKT